MKKFYEKPTVDVVIVTAKQHLLENSGETDDPMSKSNSDWENEDTNLEYHPADIWADEE